MTTRLPPSDFLLTSRGDTFPATCTRMSFSALAIGELARSALRSLEDRRAVNMSNKKEKKKRLFHWFISSLSVNVVLKRSSAPFFHAIKIRSAAYYTAAEVLI